MAMPSLFVSHGAPTIILDETPAREAMTKLAEGLRHPTAIVCVTAHWETQVPAIGSAARPGMIYDFRGFPQPLYEMTYAAPGDPALAAKMVRVLEEAGLAAEAVDGRGYDHGTWVPLMLAFPDADVPVVQISVQPERSAADHIALGRALAPFVEDDVLVIGSGGATHNLRDIDFRNRDRPSPNYVTEFNDWLHQTVTAGDEAALKNYEAEAPRVADNHPTVEHFLPLLVAFGAAGAGAHGTRIHQSYDFGVLSMDMYRFEAS
jgi:4,5-DOPA dioxygenase extradiol